MYRSKYIELGKLYKLSHYYPYNNNYCSYIFAEFKYAMAFLKQVIDFGNFRNTAELEDYNHDNSQIKYEYKYIHVFQMTN